MNPKLTPKDRGLIKGALRRVFSRSELRKEVMQEAISINYSDPNRPRVKKWVTCFNCKRHTPGYTAEVDHVNPVIPLDRSLEEMTWDEVIERLWCDKSLLAVLCSDCHDIKTANERELRVKFRRLKKEANENKKTVRKKSR